MIRAVAADRPDIRRFLYEYAPIAMFPLANLENHGMAGGHPRAVSFWIDRQAGTGALRAVIAVCEDGTVMPVCPSGSLAQARRALAGLQVSGLLGAAPQVAALRLALDLPPQARVDLVQPHYALTLAAMTMPACTGLSLQPLAAAPRDLVLGWRADYLRGTGFAASGDVAAVAAKDIDAALAADSHRVLIADGAPVAMTGFNARLPQIVQVGGVYTPPALRGRGLARRAVALHLAQAQAAGVGRAILFAASAAAARAYCALGFSRIGDYAIVLFDGPQVAHG